MHQDEYEGDAYIYAHEELCKIINDVCQLLLNKKELKYIGKRIHFIKLNDGDKHQIISNEFTFFDIRSTKAKQYGFMMKYDGDKKLVCCGDEPYNDALKEYAINADFMLHEAFCLYEQRDIFHPYEKHHSTVKDAAELANELNIKNIVLYHSEDKNIVNRKALYTKEGALYFKGNIYVPDDLETISI